MADFKKQNKEFESKMDDTKIIQDETGEQVAVGNSPLKSLEKLLDITDYELGQSYDAQKEAARISAPFSTMMKSPTFNEIASGIKPYAVGEDIQKAFTTSPSIDVEKNINKYKNILQKYKQLTDAELQKQNMVQRKEDKLADRDFKRQMALITAGNKPKVKTTGENALDRNFAKTYNEYINEGGASTVDTNIKKMENVLNKLKSGEVTTGGIGGLTPQNKLGALVNPKLIAAQQELESAIQGTLRPILGAQFTEKEGMMILSRAFNPALPVEDNIKKLETAIDDLKKRGKIMQESTNYFEENGTLSGFRGSDVLSGVTGSQEVSKDDMIAKIRSKVGK